MQFRTFARRTVGVLATCAVGAGTLALTAPGAAAEGTSPADSEGGVGYLAQAYGSYIYTLDREISSGPTAYTGVACTAAAPRQSTNNTAAVDVPGIAQIGATETAVETIDEDGVQASNAISETATAELLGGLVEAGAITSETTASLEDGEYTAEHESTLANLKVLGEEIDLEAGENTRIDLELPLVGTVGYIELNKQNAEEVGDEFHAATTAVHIAILDDAEVANVGALSGDQQTAQMSPGQDISLKAGTHIHIGVSRAHLEPAQDGYLTGEGYASQARLLDGTIESGKTSASGVPCEGGASNNSIADVNLGSVLNLGAATTSAEGDAEGDELTSQVVTEIGESSLLDGAIELEAIKSVATATRDRDGGEVDLSAEGTKLVGLKVNGEPVADAEIGPNTTLDLGIAEVTLNKQVESSNAIAVTALEIELLEDVAGLPTGSTVEVGHARAGIND